MYGRLSERCRLEMVVQPLKALRVVMAKALRARVQCDPPASVGALESLAGQTEVVPQAHEKAAVKGRLRRQARLPRC